MKFNVFIAFSGYTLFNANFNFLNFRKTMMPCINTAKKREFLPGGALQFKPRTSSF